MGIFNIFSRKKTVDHNARRNFLLQNGRITDGRIVDGEIARNGDEIVFYVYTLNGVDFESSEILTAEQRLSPAKYAPGAKVGVRYDPRNQGNSVIE